MAAATPTDSVRGGGAVRGATSASRDRRGGNEDIVAHVAKNGPHIVVDVDCEVDAPAFVTRRSSLPIILRISRATRRRRAWQTLDSNDRWPDPAEASLCRVRRA